MASECGPTHLYKGVLNQGLNVKVGKMRCISRNEKKNQKDGASGGEKSFQ